MNIGVRRGVRHKVERERKKEMEENGEYKVKQGGEVREETWGERVDQRRRRRKQHGSVVRILYIQVFY